MYFKSTKFLLKYKLKYILKKLDDSKSPIPVETKMGTLYKRTNGYYLLDLNKYNLGLGEYLIDIYLSKDNYKPRFIKISNVE